MSTRRRLAIMACLALFAPPLAALASVDANTASQAQLESVAGIGPAIAARIVQERRKGPFGNAQDLAARVRGIGDASVRKMVASGLVVGAAAPAVGAAAQGALARSTEVIAGYPEAPPPAARRGSTATPLAPVATGKTAGTGRRAPR